MEITEIEAIAADGKWLHRVGDESYFTRCTLLAGESENSFEEVGEKPEEPKLPYELDNTEP